ncbi:MAG: DHH family phosphoesterase [Bacilli bacterium]|nr:DHH family phosphoesterase [Bacilli bacterium]
MSLKQIYNEIIKANNVLILTHQNPDGDAIGSMMAMKTIIEKLDIPVDAVITDKFNFINKVPNANKLLTETNKTYDLMIIVDTYTKQRLGHLSNLYDDSKKVIVLDHHPVEKEIENVNYIDSTAASATTVIYDLIKENNIAIDYNLAFYLYLGLLTDTGGFAYKNISIRAFNMASDLLSYGINHAKMYVDFVAFEYDIDYLYLKKGYSLGNK